ncbi:pilus assembly protein TadG-related protein [Cereibacter sphaeroides]|uniref:pilus assembly protein TadG-related protein n=1 Tax=Cereibacter sphaeroides TaxID=1063 RepID=UPI001F171198|nr:pilus assembly protein TadG-related protein [Cereibacter sphaeroides]
MVQPRFSVSSDDHTAMAPRPGLRGRLGRFAGAEDGSVLVFGLILFILMLLIGGMAIDVMRFEYARSGTQQTLDRAVLAAASLKQVREPNEVVEDYFAKAGMSDRLVDTDWERPTLNAKQVTADGRVDVPTLFMNLMNVDMLASPAAAGAEEAVSNIEISLVLDISGSMRFNGMQITKLRTAAKEFFATVLAGDAKDFTSINIVPYAGHVNLGPDLYKAFKGGARLHGESYCLELGASDYTTAGLPAAGLPPVPHYMKWAIDSATMDWGWCPGATATVKVAQNDRAALDTYIDSIRLHDGTGTQSGIKYGLTLLNPDMRSIFDGLNTKDIIPDAFAGRPMAWPREAGSNVQKYLIVMTDGEITEQARPRYTGLRDIDTDNKDNEKVNGVSDPDTVDGINHDLWNAKVELDNQPADNRPTSNLSSKETNIARFKAQCDLAKAQGVIVYTIAFNTTSAAAAPMKYCASKPSYFFEVKDREISAAFAVIARNIRQLRLTQ